MTAQYWTMTGNDIWMLVNPVCELKNLNTGEKLQLNVLIPEHFMPVIMPNIKSRPKKKRQITKFKPEPEKAETKTRPVSARKKSNYKGVRKFGSGSFGAQYYDKDKKKVIHIGTFDHELLAAAAVQEKLGNHAESRRLRNEYQEGGGAPKVQSMSPGDLYK